MRKILVMLGATLPLSVMAQVSAPVAPVTAPTTSAAPVVNPARAPVAPVEVPLPAPGLPRTTSAAPRSPSADINPAVPTAAMPDAVGRTFATPDLANTASPTLQSQTRTPLPFGVQPVRIPPPAVTAPALTNVSRFRQTVAPLTNVPPPILPPAQAPVAVDLPPASVVTPVETPTANVVGAPLAPKIIRQFPNTPGSAADVGRERVRPPSVVRPPR